jgi:hypothetical protein
MGLNCFNSWGPFLFWVVGGPEAPVQRVWCIRATMKPRFYREDGDLVLHGTPIPDSENARVLRGM